ncbi:pentatricopeptide repeat-containing protein mitochondrial [Dorcoceras hygrometricum]|uniref:Pentatricopeptide repeat-containing protein mitochondrial n=1 Tax=Dorcoceras hygrometricum TaxID=472368 RepID=A0A2Z7AJB9_9LAMI|nr:pentatricopeptide repeat-containing protein mitochondrial [Dorcoceras hygrometricum]
MIRCLLAVNEIVITQILLAEPLGSLPFKMVQVRQLRSEWEVNPEPAAGRIQQLRELMKSVISCWWRSSNTLSFRRTRLVALEEVSAGSSCVGARINEKATRVGQPFGVDCWIVALSAVAL